MTGKVTEVKAYFEDSQRYLSSRGFEVKVRAETVRSFVKDAKFARILDVGCGDGSISLPLLSKETQLTLLDISESMLSIARSKIPSELSDNVEVVNEDLMNAKIERHCFDLIICLGVLGHVDCPTEFVARMVSLLKLRGTLIVEFTDSFHFTRRFMRFYNIVRGLLRPMPYTLNLLSSGQVLEMFTNHNLRLQAVYRYGFPLPGRHKFFSQATLYKLVRLAFGTSDQPRNAWMGDEYIVLLTRVLPI